MAAGGNIWKQFSGIRQWATTLVMAAGMMDRSAISKCGTIEI